jgi:ATP-dependent RNA helicase RhlE
MNNFSELTLPSVLGSNLTRNGFKEPTPVQAQAIPAALAGRDVIATAQTGTGKTLAFVLPILNSLTTMKERSGIHAVVLSPTRELALQIHETFAKIAAGTGIRDAVVVGGMSENTQLRAIRGGARVLIATPGRLADYIERKLVNLGKTQIFVLDEADRMLDMGFLPVIRRIMGELPSSRQTLFFSATIERSVAHLIQEHVKNPVRVAIGETTRTADNVDLHLYEVEQERKLGLLKHMLELHEGSFLVFARTKHGTDKLAKNLAGVGVKAARIHGNRTQGQRNQALKGFQTGEYRVLVATDVAARGIHVDGIAHVVNFDLPQAPEDFIHRVGRTGRAGARGTASTFGTRSERGDIRRIEQLLSLRLTRQTVPENIAKQSESKVIMLPGSQAFAERNESRPRRAVASFRPRRRG